MKKLFALLIVLFCIGCSSSKHTYQYSPETLWYKKTVHKPVKKMTKHQLSNAMNGKSMYFRKNGEVHKR